MKSGFTSSPWLYCFLCTGILGIFLCVHGLLQGSQNQDLIREFEKHEKALSEIATGAIPQSLSSKATPALPLQTSKPEPQALPQKLSVWVTYNDEQFEVYTRLVKKFETLHKVKIEISRIPFDGQAEKFLYACTSRTTPDIARMDIGNIAKFAAGKALVALDDLGLGSLQNDLLPAAMESGKVLSESGGLRYFALPDEFTNTALFYNKDMFADVGLNPENPPKDWEEFMDYAKKLTKDNNRDGLPDQYGFAMRNTLWWSMPFLYSFGGRIVNEEKLACLLNEKEAVEGLQFQIDLSRQKLEAEAWRAGAIDPDTGFKNGKYAMILSGPWNLANFRKSNINFGVALIPNNRKTGITSATSIGGNSNVIFKTCKNVPLAFEFLKYLVSVEVQKTMHEELNSIPLNLGLERSGYVFRSPEMKIFIEQARFAQARPRIPGYDMMENIVNNEVETAFLGSRTAQEAYTNACKRIETRILSELKPAK